MSTDHQLKPWRAGVAFLSCVCLALIGWAAHNQPMLVAMTFVAGMWLEDWFARMRRTYG